jgi:hypothetical protein
MVQFYMRKDYIPICRLFSGPLIERSSGPSFKRRKKSEFEACVSHVGDCVYGGLRQARVIVI